MSQEGKQMEPVCDSSLEQHLERIEGYMRSCDLLTSPRRPSALRNELCAFLSAELPAAVDAWVGVVGPGLEIPPWDWTDLRDSMHMALVRWISHIQDPANIETYVYLRSHARRAFISHFPASRFLSGQMKI